MSLQVNKEMADDPFWGTKPDVLWQNTDSLLEFLPSEDMSINKRCNALTRFFIYLGCIVSIKRNDLKSLFLYGALPSALIYVYWHRLKQPHEPWQQFLISLFVDLTPSSRSERFAPLTSAYTDPYHGRIPTPASSQCRVPTFQNPYMNPLSSMWGTRDANIKACDIDNPDVQKIIKANESASGWFDNDPADVYQNQQGQRELQINMGDYLVPDYNGESRDWFYKPEFGVKTRKEGGAYTPYNSTRYGQRAVDGWTLPKLQGIDQDE